MIIPLLLIISMIFTPQITLPYQETQWSDLSKDTTHIIGCSIDKYTIQLGVFALQQQSIKLVLSVQEQTPEIEKLHDCIADFIEHIRNKYDLSLEYLCIAISGTTQPKRDWIQSPHFAQPIYAGEIARKTHLQKIIIVNDFEIIGYGIPFVESSNIVTLNKGKVLPGEPQAIIGAGAGLGTSFMVWNKQENSYLTLPLALNFTPFTPLDEQEFEYFNFLRTQQPENHVGWGTVLGSKGGLPSIYRFLKGNSDENTLDTNTIFAQARAHEPLSEQAVKFYLKLYARAIRILIYFVLPYNGVYITNRVALDNLDFITDPAFTKEIFTTQNSYLENIIRDIPVYVISDPKIHMYGAAGYLARKLAP